MVSSCMCSDAWQTHSAMVHIGMENHTTYGIDQHAGLSPSRTTVPPSERTPTAWFLSEQQEKMPALASVNGQTVPVQLPESIAVPLQQTWSNACLQFQKTFAAVHMLRDAVRNSKHGDISQHEAARMTTVAEHLLHIMRQQQSAAYTSCRQICSMEHLCRLLVETLTSPCASFNDAHCRFAHARGPVRFQRIKHVQTSRQVSEFHIWWQCCSW